MKLKLFCTKVVEIEESDLYKRMTELGIPEWNQIQIVEELKRKQNSILEKIKREYPFI